MTFGTAYYNNAGLTVTANGTSGQPLLSAGASAPGYGNLAVGAGGTGLTTLTTAYGVVCAGTTPTGALQNAGAGTAGQVLTSGGASALPSYQNASSATKFISTLSATGTNLTGDGTQYTLVCNTVTLNTGSGYAGGTGIFTAPSTGTYFFTFNIFLSNLIATHTNVYVYFQIVTVSSDRVISLNPYITQNSSGEFGISGSIVKSMTASQTAKVIIAVSGGTKTVSVVGGTGDTYSSFSGWQI